MVDATKSPINWGNQYINIGFLHYAGCRSWFGLIYLKFEEIKPHYALPAKAN